MNVFCQKAVVCRIERLRRQWADLKASIAGLGSTEQEQISEAHKGNHGTKAPGRQRSSAHATLLGSATTYQGKLRLEKDQARAIGLA